MRSAPRSSAAAGQAMVYQTADGPLPKWPYRRTKASPGDAENTRRAPSRPCPPECIMKRAAWSIEAPGHSVAHDGRHAEQLRSPEPESMWDERAPIFRPNRGRHEQTTRQHPIMTWAENIGCDVDTLERASTGIAGVIPRRRDQSGAQNPSPSTEARMNPWRRSMTSAQNAPRPVSRASQQEY